MYKIPAKTLFTGKNLVFVPECHSTNALAGELNQMAAFADGTVVITDNQSRGKGQAGNTWNTEPGKNLTLSFVIKPTFLAITDQFYLNMIASLAVIDLLASLEIKTVNIKWPNDVLIDSKKTCGILIENQIQGSVLTSSIVGIGLNVNQIEFPEPRATSIKMTTHRNHDLQFVFEKLCEMLEGWYLKLKEGAKNDIRGSYYEYLFQYNKMAQLKDKDGPFEGVISGVDEIGRLCVNTSGGLRYFNTKEVQLVY